MPAMVCGRERKREREREKGRGRVRERERSISLWSRRVREEEKNATFLSHICAKDIEVRSIRM
jgi:hypothetical protein